eukprot:983376-Rhodomonas_salina.2
MRSQDHPRQDAGQGAAGGSQIVSLQSGPDCAALGPGSVSCLFVRSVRGQCALLLGSPDKMWCQIQAVGTYRLSAAAAWVQSHGRRRPGMLPSSPFLRCSDACDHVVDCAGTYFQFLMQVLCSMLLQPWNSLGACCEQDQMLNASSNQDDDDDDDWEGASWFRGRRLSCSSFRGQTTLCWACKGLFASDMKRLQDVEQQAKPHCPVELVQLMSDAARSMLLCNGHTSVGCMLPA